MTCEQDGAGYRRGDPFHLDGSAPRDGLCPDTTVFGAVGVGVGVRARARVRVSRA